MNYPTPQYEPQQQYPQAPQQFAPPAPVQQPQYPQAPGQQGFAQQPQFQQPGYPQAAPQPPVQPLAQGSIDDFYSQPSASGGPSISWTDAQGGPKPIGTQYVGIVARDVTKADIQQQTDFNTKAPLFYKDGRPKFAMKVPLKVQPSQEFPDGEATWYVKGQARDELVRAMSEAGDDGAPKGGAAISITLVQRRATQRGLNPANVVQVQYQPPGGPGARQESVQEGNGGVRLQPPAPVQQPAPAQQFAQQPVQQQFVPQAEQQPVQQFAQPAPQQAPAQPQFQPPVQQQAPAQQFAPQAQAAPPQAPADFNAEQAQLLARLTGQQQPVAQAG
jgi:hypothetical protein